MKLYARPFVKWAGGKSTLLRQFEEWLPHKFLNDNDVTYVEPFVGGGAMLFYLLRRYPRIHRVVINDINEDLMTCYSLVKNNPKELIRLLGRIEKEYLALNQTDRRLYYYALRESYNKRSSSQSKLAAQFYFLNHTCFNGLYRVNSHSAFNVPFGNIAHPIICNKELINTDHTLLNSVDLTILCGNYQSVDDHIRVDERTFVYLDPPYLPISVTSYFKQYSNVPFGIKEQEDLKVFCDHLSGEGCLFMLSNSDCKLDDGTSSYFEQLYADYDFHKVVARRMINSQGEKRGQLSEVLIRNYIDE